LVDITDNIDINLLKMCHEIITLSKTKRIVIELNDSFFINTYINKLSIDDTTRKQLNHLISLKSMDEITQYYKSKKLSNRKLTELHDLLELVGPASIIKKIRRIFKKI
jgi:ATP phosphoribosyltransferase regulatory subunit HisZ